MVDSETAIFVATARWNGNMQQSQSNNYASPLNIRYIVKQEGSSLQLCAPSP
jgi:hypothetical protein